MIDSSNSFVSAISVVRHCACVFPAADELDCTPTHKWESKLRRERVVKIEAVAHSSCSSRSFRRAAVAARPSSSALKVNSEPLIAKPERIPSRLKCIEKSEQQVAAQVASVAHLKPEFRRLSPRKCQLSRVHTERMLVHVQFNETTTRLGHKISSFLAANHHQRLFSAQTQSTNDICSS